jgi:hypothetical protein
MRAFTKRVLNPLVLGVARRRHSADYAILRHVGRRSGRSYATPVVAHPVDDGFLIALPYGATVMELPSWSYRHGATVMELPSIGAAICWRPVEARCGGTESATEVRAPEVLDAAALPLLPDWIRRALGPFHIGQFLRLRWLTTAPTELAIPSGTEQRAR